MATADVEAGIGGIDASITFETDRAENVGGAFNASFNFFVGFQNNRVSSKFGFFSHVTCY